MSNSKRAREWSFINISGLNSYVIQINTNTYNDYNISNQCFQYDSAYKRANDMRVSCEMIFQ